MITRNDIQQIIGTDVYAGDGDKIGSAGQVYLDNNTGNPEWVSVKTGLFGTKESFVPLEGARLSGDRLEVPYAKSQVKDAPRVDVDDELSPGQEEELYRYYGRAAGHDRSDGDTRRNTETTSDTVTDTGRDDTRDRSGDNAMTRSEERLVADTRTERAGTARLRKHVVTEQQQVTVPVTREEVTLEREPITDANAGNALDGPAITESEHEVTLHAERPVVETEAVPVERVRLGKQTVTGEETVGGEVRKEQIDFDGPEDRDASNR